MSDADYDTVRAAALEEFAAELARSAHTPVEEAHRGRGLGRATMLAAEEPLRGDGCTRIALNVWGCNRRAILLHDSLGYQVDSQQMSKSLTGEAEG
jgi:GNAT superfamily N-acetyltransferase